MSQVAIRVNNLGKLYRLGVKPGTYSLRESLHHLLASPFRSGEPGPEQAIWALKDVSFDVGAEDALGIIGRNGAGKSTLLKILSRITEPTEGSVEIHGRVISLLEVGTGFHPDLTGGENIYLNGAMMGMKKEEIDRKFDDIVEFSEIGKFIDTPVRRYSSGMYVRLAFGVAAHLEPEILIVDEILAVGDAAFQKKCIGRMESVAKQGRTVLFVSHNMAAVENLCRRGIVLDQGRIVFIGSQSDAIARYLSMLDPPTRNLADRNDRTGSGEVRITGVVFKDAAGRVLNTLRSGQDVRVFLYYEASQEFQGSVTASIAIRTQMDIPVFLQHNRLAGVHWKSIPPRGAFVCALKELPLPPSLYYLGFSILRTGGEFLDRLPNAVKMVVTEGDFFSSGEVPPISHGVTLVKANWQIQEDFENEGGTLTADSLHPGDEIS